MLEENSTVNIFWKEYLGQAKFVDMRQSQWPVGTWARAANDRSPSQPQRQLALDSSKRDDQLTWSRGDFRQGHDTQSGGYQSIQSTPQVSATDVVTWQVH